MQVVPLSCPQCGGSQDISEDQRLVECRYCRTLLRVERSGSGELDRLLIEAQQENAELSLENQILHIQNGIHRLENAWEERREAYLMHTKDGKVEPSKLMGSMFMAAGGTAVVASLIVAISNPVFVGISIGGLLVALWGFSIRLRGTRFEDARNAYVRRHKELTQQLAQLERRANQRPSYEDTTARRRRLDRISYPAADA